MLLLTALIASVPVISAVVNAASYAEGPVAPGEAVVIYGTGLGPTTLTTSAIPELRVYFDETPAPVLYASEKQTSVLVPFPVENRPRTRLRAEYQGAVSEAVELAVAASAPGIFTMDASGRGQAAAINHNEGVNGEDRPAGDGGIVSLYVTGLGPLDPVGVDGQIAGNDLQRHRLQVSVQVAGAEAEVLYAGSAPGMISGISQVNFRVPPGVAQGLVPVVVKAGNSASQDTAHIAIRLGAADSGAVSYLNNGVVRVGADLALGGAITYLAAAGGGNMVNSHDYGRQIQQSYYSGPRPYGGPSHPNWPDWPWNPIGTGDVYRNRSRTLAFFNDGNTLYVRSVPLQWALNNVPCECTFETWIRLEGNAARVRARLDNGRADTTQYPAYGQELPAVYTNGTFYRLFTYDGGEPFRGGPFRQVANAGPPWSSWDATENWAALVNDAGFGLGVYHPGVYRFSGGFAGAPNTGGPYDFSTGYISPFRMEILDHNIAYEYSYDLIAGTLEEIRSYVYSRRASALPEYLFARDRQHWRLMNASDTGFPLRGRWVIHTGRNDPYAIGPQAFWDAADIPKFYVRATHHTALASAQMFWSVPGEGFSASRVVTFPVINDGEFHTYEVDLSASPAYRGAITGIRFDPVAAGAAGEYVEVESISHRPRE